MTDGQCYELFGGIALKNHAFLEAIAIVVVVVAVVVVVVVVTGKFVDVDLVDNRPFGRI